MREATTTGPTGPIPLNNNAIKHSPIESHVKSGGHDNFEPFIALIDQMDSDAEFIVEQEIPPDYEELEAADNNPYGFFARGLNVLASPKIEAPAANDEPISVKTLAQEPTIPDMPKLPSQLRDVLTAERHVKPEICALSVDGENFATSGKGELVKAATPQIQTPQSHEDPTYVAPIRHFTGLAPSTKELSEALNVQNASSRLEGVHIIFERSVGGVKTLQLKLNPAELGTVSARVRLVCGEMKVHLVAQNADAAHALNTDRRLIEKALNVGGGTSELRITISVMERGTAGIIQPTTNQHVPQQTAPTQDSNFNSDGNDSPYSQSPAQFADEKRNAKEGAEQARRNLFSIRNQVHEKNIENAGSIVGHLRDIVV